LHAVFLKVQSDPGFLGHQILTESQMTKVFLMLFRSRGGLSKSVKVQGECNSDNVVTEASFSVVFRTAQKKTKLVSSITAVKGNTTENDPGRTRTCNPQIRSLMRFHCATRSMLHTGKSKKIIFA
jgi:hypothetical protein